MSTIEKPISPERIVEKLEKFRERDSRVMAPRASKEVERETNPNVVVSPLRNRRHVIAQREPIEQESKTSFV